MGVKSFFKRVFIGESDEDAELRAARARHNIVVEEKKPKKEEAEQERYDPWEEIDNLRRSFFLGGWATRKLGIRPDHDKLKEELDALERKREEKRKAKEEGRQ